MHNLKKKFYTAYNSSLHSRAEELRKHMTPQEAKLWFRFLKPHQLKWYRQRIINRFIVEGLTEGKNQEKIATAKRMLRMHLSIQDVAKATMLSIAEIKELQEKMLQPV